MSINDIAGLDSLCSQHGISLDYYDIGGHRWEPDVEVKRALLAALEAPVDTDADIQRQFEALTSRQWSEPVPPVLVYRMHDQQRRFRLTLTEAQCANPFQWRLEEESGAQHQGSWTLDPEQAIADTTLYNIRWLQFEVDLPQISSPGYHNLLTRSGDQTEQHSTVIIAPEHCYQGPVFDNHRKTWGISLQLYALRSRRNWGIGDYTDLQTAVDRLAPLGLDAIGLNPLHALFAHRPEDASPYSPSSRDFLNPLYLDVEAIEGFQLSSAAQTMASDPDFLASLQALRERDLIDYSAVWAAKFPMLNILYRDFSNTLSDEHSALVVDFRRFQQDGGEDLFRFSLFEALQASFHALDSELTNWQQWPAPYRDPDSVESKTWAESHPEEIEFHQYLQWQGDCQLAAVQRSCLAQGMAIGLYRDLAVGDEKSSASCWADQDHYALDMGIGAPADDFNRNGQNWALPPPHPRHLARHAYHHFIQTLRANMRHAGALRIDHIMGLMRLFWIPPGYSPERGTYVSYPFTDLLAILALESQRNECLVIGEDLGTVPDDVRHALDVNRILSYRILFFEKDWNHGTMKPPADYPRYALCTAGSHDLPTLRGYWQGIDLELHEQLGLHPGAEFSSRQQELRAQDRQQMLAALEKENLVSPEEVVAQQTRPDLNDELACSIQRYLARSQAMLHMVQIEDLLAETLQINLPGTIDEYPNWRSKLTGDIEEWSEFDFEAFGAVIKQERNA